MAGGHAVGMRHITDEERRARLGRRHAIAAPHRVASVEAAVSAMTALHATEAASVYLSSVARVDGLTVADIDRALYDDRTVVKQLAMRRTLFAFPGDVLPAAWGSASARVATQERARLAKGVAAAGITDDGDAWVEAACTAVLRHLADADTGTGLSATELREQVPELAGRVTVAPGKRYGGEFPVAPRVLTLLGARGRIVRGPNAGHWRISRPTWLLTERWLDEPPAPHPEAKGYAELVGRWLRTFGPGTTTDIQWWLGGTLTAVRQALADLGAVEVSLDGGMTGWVLPDDLEPQPAVAPWAALLPVLDPTPMGWKERRFYLGDHGARIVDAAGNAGTTAWYDGRIAGSWGQDPDGVVEIVALHDLDRETRAALEEEAERLTAWLDGTRVGTVYWSPLLQAAGYRPARRS
jgi:hypothetical protein